MRVLVTGGAGFLGSHVADVLAEKGHEVTVFDREPSPYLSGKQTMLVGDILDERTLAKAVEGQEVVYHFAGIADIDECTIRPVDTVEINVLGTVKLLEACVQSGSVRRFLFASSAYVYSDSGSFYRASKQACESFIENYHELHGLEYTNLRYGSLYGDRADGRNSIYRMLTSALQNKRISYRGSGDEIREFIHVRDAAEISVRVLAEEYANQHVVLTGTEKYKYSELIEMILEILGGDIEVDMQPSTRKAHYKITPYNFSPKLGRKVVSNDFIDIGQGLLQCLASIYSQIHSEKQENLGILTEDGDQAKGS